MSHRNSPRLARLSRRVSIRSHCRAAKVTGAIIEALEQRRMLNAAIVVNTTDDESIANATTSLREAVALAETQAGDDTITFDPTIFDSGSLHTITLGAEPVDLTGANGGLTITGPGSGVLAISSATSGRAFDVGSSAVATISGMTMSDGSAQGGAVSNQGNLSLTSVVINGNKFIGGVGVNNPASDGGIGDEAVGGAIYNTGVLTLTSSTVSNNAATGGEGGTGAAVGGQGGAGVGGGIYSTNKLTIQSCTFSGNLATGGAGNSGVTNGGAGGTGFGGAVYVSGGTLDIEDSDFESNEAKGGAAAIGGLGSGGTGGGAIGGAIYCDGALTLNGSQINSSEAAGGAGGDAGFGGGGAGGIGEGGSIYAGGSVTGSTNTIATSEADGGLNGGAVLGDNGAAGGEALGGSLMLASTASGSLVETNFNGSSTSGGAGGAAGGLGTGGSGGDAIGGAVAAFCGNFTFQDCQFSSDSATGGSGGSLAETGGAGGDVRGGAIYYNGTGTLDVDGGKISDCQAIGGTDGAASLGNEAGTAGGGGIAADGKLALYAVTIQDNSVTGGDGIADAASAGGNATGGGVQATTDVSFIQVDLEGNKANGGFGTGGPSGEALGGGVEIAGGAFSMQTSSVTDNVVTGGTNFGHTPAIDGGLAVGAGIYAGGSSNSITTSLIFNNSATGGDGSSATSGNGGAGGGSGGGGVYASTAIKVTDSTIVSNTITAGDGGAGATGSNGGDSGFAIAGGIYGGAALTLINNTITSNLANSGIAGAAGSGGIAGQVSASQGGGVAGNGIPSLTNNIVANNTATDGADVFGTIDASHNLIKSTSGITFNTNVSNITGVDPQLGALADNGGLSLTLKPNSSSPVFNAGDNTAALAEFGVNGTDQRGPGFPRFLGPVDIGAVESGIAVIQVSGNGNAIVNNDTTPSTADFTDFGTTDRAAANPLERMFTVTNVGQLPLTLSAPVLPAGYSIVEGLSSSIGAGLSDTFTVRLSDLTAGVFAGNIVINSNDPNTPAFTFKITGTISPTIKINFEPVASPIPDTFAADTGSIFGNRGNGLSYGWNASASSFARDRNLLSDQSKDTFIHTQLYGTRTWEISVPNGAYQVHLVAGDPQYIDSTYKINAESTVLVNGKPTSGNHFVEGTATIIVTDGRLTLSNASGAVNNKFDYVEITPITTPSVKINFETTTSPTPAGYLPDTGSVFGNRGNGFSYGWNLSATSFARDRNALNSPNQLQDTFIHTELYGDRFWELALPNGNYSVKIVAGDPSYTDSVDKYNLEGILALSGTPTNANHWVQGTITVAVTDGRLTLTNAAGSVNNKIDYIEVTPV